MSSSSPPPVPTAAQRKDCYRARDNYYKCLAENDGKNAVGDGVPCGNLKKIYETVCLPSWVKYFERKRVYDQYKTKVQDEGYQEKQ